MSELYVESPLAHREAPQGLSIDLREITDRGMIDLRGSANDKKFMSAVKKILGLDLPKTPRTSVSWGDVKALWLSIDQWFILSSHAKATELAKSLAAELNGIHSLVINVSDMRAVLRLEGDGVREVLLKGSSLDLLSENFAAGTVRRMRYAEIAALLHVVEDKVFDIYVFRSYADYAWEFLLATARAPAKITLFGAQDIAI
jgi:sarcosine oxidase, subunit gamma